MSTTKATDATEPAEATDAAGTTDAEATDATELGTKPAAPPPQRPGRSAWLTVPIRAWRNLTSMRTALLLLLALAVASVPGTVFPQRNLNLGKVNEYYAEHPDLAPILDKAGIFGVFGSSWFAAIYLLLFVSLIGCLTPRLRLHARAMVRRPPAAPKHLDRLPNSGAFDVDGEPAEHAATIRSALRRSRWRTSTRTEDGGAITVSAEKGYLRETGNLVFHLALVAVLVGVASGALYGWSGGALFAERGTFCNSVQAYDQFTPGRRVSDAALPPFCVTLDDFRATYLDTGQPVGYTADVRYVDGSRALDSDPSTKFRLEVNEPLRLDGANIYLINHGYSPVLRYTDRFGTVFEQATPFLPEDGLMTSQGAYVLPDANQDPRNPKRDNDAQMAFTGYFLPTAPTSGPPIQSTFPAATRPAVTLLAYRGDTGLDSGRPQSVYSVDQGQVQAGKLKPVGTKQLFPGETWKLDDGTTLAFVGYREWASVSIRHDPGEKTVLIGAISIVAGLVASLTVRRRRIWFRIAGTSVTAGGLARSGSGRYAAEFDRTVASMAARTGSDDVRTYERI